MRFSRILVWLAAVSLAGGLHAEEAFALRFVPQGKTFRSLGEFSYSLEVAPNQRASIRSVELEIRNAAADTRIARIPYEWEIGQGLKDERPRRQQGWRTRIDEQSVRRIGPLPPGEYLAAFLVNGERASNVAAVRIDPAFDVAKAPTFAWGVIEPTPQKKHASPILWAIGPSPGDPRISNYSLVSSGIEVDGISRQAPAMGWTGIIGLIQGGDRSYHIIRPREYSPPIDVEVPHTYGFTLAGRMAAPLVADLRKTPLADIWDQTDAKPAPAGPVIVRGTVLDARGRPAAGYSVMLKTPVHAVATEETDAEGRYVFSGSLPAGVYELCVSKSWTKPAKFRERFDLEGNANRVRDFDFRKPGMDASRAKADVPRSGPSYTDLDLVEKNPGRNPNQRSQDGQTPLSMAARTGRLDLARKLIEAGADVNALIGATSSVLLAAIDGRHAEIAKLLVEKGADVNLAPSEGYPPLIEAVRLGNADLVEYLLDHGAEVRADDSEGLDAMAHAARAGHRDLITLLAKRGAGIEHMDNGGRTPLMLAAMVGKTDAVNALVAAGAKVNFANQDGFTALSFACFRRINNGEDAGVILALLAAGAKASPRTTLGDTPLTGAVRSGNLFALEPLAKAGADLPGAEGTQALAEAFRRRASATVSELLRLGANPETPFDHHFPPLLYAISITGDAPTVEALIAGGANVNAPVPEPDNESSPLMIAASLGQKAIVRALIKAGANVNYRDWKGRSVLEAAKQSKKPEVTAALVGAGAKS